MLVRADSSATNFLALAASEGPGVDSRQKSADCKLFAAIDAPSAG